MENKKRKVSVATVYTDNCLYPFGCTQSSDPINQLTEKRKSAITTSGVFSLPTE